MVEMLILKIPKLMLFTIYNKDNDDEVGGMMMKTFLVMMTMTTEHALVLP